MFDNNKLSSNMYLDNKQKNQEFSNYEKIYVGIVGNAGVGS